MKRKDIILCVETSVNTYMLLAGWEVRVWKNCDRGPRPRAAFSSPTLRRPITFLFFSSCRKLAYKWVCLRNFAIESAYAPSTNHSQKI